MPEVETSQVLEVVETRAVGNINKYYSVLPGSPEWSSFQSGDEMLNACQLSKNQLETMNIDDLVNACLQFPLAYDFLFVNDDRTAIRFDIDNFNGLNFLLEKKQAINSLITLYGEMPFDIQKNIVDGVIRYTPFTFSYLELIFADDKFLNKATKQELLILEKNISKKYSEKLTFVDYVGSDHFRRTLYLWSKVRISLGDKSSIYTDFIENYLDLSEEIFNSVASQLLIKK